MLTSSVLSIFLWSISLAEWVDMPEFSDEKKIYRISSPRQDHFYTLSQKPAENQFPYVYESIPGKDFSEQTAVNGSGGFVTHQLEDSDNGATIHENASEENLFLTSTDEHKDTTDSSTVDLLFRNMNNSTATTTGATLLLGRRKKSINGFDEDTARILNGMEKFSYNL
ncbi:hypothetical protein WN55_02276 [Dufourea novaeangliae]|uniref:Uncharacterized protein n=1 Tax=Dufourea novaeangliae TaxID=178035 RepID=A0A154PG68_DUFNO|nr:hypothetical protein WN55_02276 [Dufourea novaeangliae]